VVGSSPKSTIVTVWAATTPQAPTSVQRTSGTNA